MKKFLLFPFIVLLLVLLCVCAEASEVRLGVMSFTSKVPDVPDETAAAISDYFLRTLIKAGGLRLVERERLDIIGNEIKAGVSGIIDSETAVQVGKLAGCTHMLLGALTNLSNTKTSKGFAGVYSKDKKKVSATIDVRIVKVETGDVIFADSVWAEVEQEDESYKIFNVTKNKTGIDGLESTAIAKAVERITPAVAERLRGRRKPKAQQVANTDTKPKSASFSSRNRADYENSSTDPVKVVNSYGLNKDDTNRLIARHKDALNMKSNSAKVQEYANMFSANTTDYLAAYYAALAEYNMNHGSASLAWCNRALKVNPRYYPANALRKKAEGLMKQ
mgnify:CR=1 FL=1